MVVKRKLSCGSNVFDFPSIPKAPRSSLRRKVSSSKLADDKDNSQICAIDLLASLAGKLLEESESSSTSTTYANHDHLGGGVIKQEVLEDVYNNNKPCKSEFSDHVNLASKSTSSVTCLQVSSVDNDGILEQTPVFSDCKKEECGLKSLVGTEEETCVVNEAGGFVADGFSLKDPSQLRLQSPESVHLDGDVKLAPCTDRVLDDSFEGYVNHSKLVCRDDDDNYCKYYKFSDNCKKSYRPPPSRVGNRRIKKCVMKNYGRGVSKLKCSEDTRTDGHLKALYRKRKLPYYGYNPWKRETVHRKRRLSDKGLVVNYDGGLSSESVSNSPLKRESEDGILSSEIGLHLKDSPVKFSIKSLRIPELVIEVPETATVGLLKRTVKEAVTALLGGGIRIGVLVQGKKVRDDSSTLSQTGLSCRDNNLGFTLEPGPETLPVPLCSETPVVSMPTDSTDLSERSAASPALDIVIPLPPQDADLLINSGKSVETNHELVPYQSDISADEQPSSDSRALVPVSALESGPLAIVPLNEKPKRTELSQRRTRRPFSVTEVEALVQAVEEVGTGRWRDVKLRSFENASHRTYVDLKDKWKTLVHTASISPQQRRGEPVPQELLDRVLAAHRHWSEHQMKQNGKLQVATTMVVVQSGSSM
ncbi:PREDICTED: telomere repeat-binding protein 4-like [Camelina sativa]|uniref:Telomere repeat-binding protein 4-like n=1 Tax=Camelina sativa TaxID=90675 RepID=A0ABM0XWW1_CAMSA|nr:PREDICTED: telomere repeat-binding protein 4-like [Camelina sativa]